MVEVMAVAREQATRRFRKVLVANRGEIAIRVFRACTELGIATVAVYTTEDRFSLHRYKADEAYRIGKDLDPVKAYLHIEEIIEVAQRSGCDAIHPGYGFLSENEAFAKACAKADITFIGPLPQHLALFGNKITAKQVAVEAGLPVVPGSPHVVDLAGAQSFADQVGYPVMLKAASGGGGRGMRIVQSAAELTEAFNRAASEAEQSFGSADVYVEKFIDHPRHIEIQILGDSEGHIVHLYERDCSIQRRHQKIVELAPSRLAPQLREDLCQSAVGLMAYVGYVNAGTVEFLVGSDGAFYFIEVNPRIQVEHTVTELVTGIDIVQSQIRIAQGFALASAEVGIPNQAAVTVRGYAIQCRITTEDPENNFLPDTGRISTYRAAAGFGVRLDSGNGFAGARVSLHYDSLLEKLCTYAVSFDLAAQKMHRALQEFRIRGVKTNLPFLLNVVHHPAFLSGNVDVNFIETHPELFNFPERRDRGNKLLNYIADVTIHGPSGIGPELKPKFGDVLTPAAVVHSARLMPPAAPHVAMRWPAAPHRAQEPAVGTAPTNDEGSRTLLQRLGVKEFLSFIAQSERLWLTDTTFRDAHQSLLATRVRTRDLLAISPATAHVGRNLFSLEVWGGATFDVSMRFLKEDPWARLAKLREAIPNVLFQMLLRGANAVGYKNYPDNVIRRFVQQTADSGVDVFRIFDSLNWLPNLAVAIDATRTSGAIAEAAICYSGDILSPTEHKYTLAYYVELAQALEQLGAQVLCIKDMAGLLKPYAAEKLVHALREHVGLPIHLHTHDTSGSGVATLLKASEAGVDIVDVAVSSLAGMTSQPSWNAVVAALTQTPRATQDSLLELQGLSDYWTGVRAYYERFETGLQASSASVYQHQMPGGQYTNLREQAIALGIGDQFAEVEHAYIAVNRMLGDIIKVTPSSKMVGDFALFMVQNGLEEATLMENADSLDFPTSVVDYFMGHMGQPYGGFPAQLQKAVLKGRQPLTTRPGEHLPDVDFVVEAATLAQRTGREPTAEQVLSYVLYPQVTEEFLKHSSRYGDLSNMDTLTFFYGMVPGEEISVEIETGKSLIVKLVSIGERQEDGKRSVIFELNGQSRQLEVLDRNAPKSAQTARKLSGSVNEVGATMPGRVLDVAVQAGDTVHKGQLLFVTEAMKMELQVLAPKDAFVQEVCVRIGSQVEPGDLLLVLA